MAEQKTADWLTDSYDYERPRRGQFRQGVILRVGEHGVILDVGLKRDGFVPPSDIERLGEEALSRLEPGQEVTARIVRPEDREGKLVLSLYQARLEKDWKRAQKMLESGDLWQSEVTGYNRGGLTVKFGKLDGFVPGSHLLALDNRSLSAEQREEKFKTYVGQEIALKVIEVKRQRRRLIFSERLAQRQLRQKNLERLLDELLEGQVCQGKVCRLCDFGAFVDLGGADGLVHISELAWQRIRHPSEVVQVGDEVQVYVLRLDHERKRIGLSLKRLQPDPWELVEKTYGEGLLVAGEVTNVVDFGAFVALDVGVEGLVHISELADPPPEKPQEVVRRGEQLVLRILRIEAHRHRIGLSLRRVSDQEREEWLRDKEPADDPSPEEDEEPPAEETDVVEEAISSLLEQAQK